MQMKKIATLVLFSLLALSTYVFASTGATADYTRAACGGSCCGSCGMNL